MNPDMANMQQPSSMQSTMQMSQVNNDLAEQSTDGQYHQMNPSASVQSMY
jgi:hypothetical protein